MRQVGATQTPAGELPAQVAEAIAALQRLSATEKLTVAKLLLESVLTDELSERTAWTALGLESFQREWDNPEDAIYDQWREHYRVPTR